jgi:hypothetical protein
MFGANSKTGNVRRPATRGAGPARSRSPSRCCRNKPAPSKPASPWGNVNTRERLARRGEAARYRTSGANSESWDGRLIVTTSAASTRMSSHDRKSRRRRGSRLVHAQGFLKATGKTLRDAIRDLKFGLLDRRQIGPAYKYGLFQPRQPEAARPGLKHVPARPEAVRFGVPINGAETAGASADARPSRGDRPCDGR